MNIDLSGKTAIVTGSTKGIGFATALGLARAGARSVVTGRDKGRVEEAAGRITAQVPGGVVIGGAPRRATPLGGGGRGVSGSGSPNHTHNPPPHPPPRPRHVRNAHALGESEIEG
ncbi:SDR family NAD(P)-dependent oxidoreductase, partial [Streptomyces sp. NPDC059455]|uniref:SDR family NAD(P)-dependent oxidoreductase n=1 Tax=Streptomyces sp. NPDC059455 TaxID=3346837 RepID=UPI0036B3D988